MLLMKTTLKLALEAMNLSGNRDPHFYAATSEIRQAHFRASKLKIPVTFREQESFKSLKLA